MLQEILLDIFMADNETDDKNLGVAMSTAAGGKSSGVDSGMSAVTGVLVTGSVTAAAVSADTVGIGSVTLPAVRCVSVGISSGDCSMAADASTSNNGALTAETTKQ